MIPDAYSAVLDPTEEMPNREQLALNARSGIAIDQQGINWGDAAIQAFMADARVGSGKVDFRFPNRAVTIPLGLGMDESGNFDRARNALQQKVALLQESGGVIKRGDDLNPLYADIISASLSVPDVWGDSAELEPGVTLSLECSPDFYGPELALDPLVSSKGSLAKVLTAGGAQAPISGAFPGRVSLTVAMAAGSPTLEKQRRGGLVWAFRKRNYDAAAPLILNAADLFPSFGAVVADAYAVSGNSMQYSVVGPSWNSVLEIRHTTSWFPHVGTYRVWVRAAAVASVGQPEGGIRLRWDRGGVITPITNTKAPWPANYSSGDYVLMNLGLISLNKLPLSPQVWTGLIDVSGGTATLFTAKIDQIYLQPVDEYAGIVSSNPNAIFASDAAVPTYPKTSALRWDGCICEGVLGYRPLVTYGNLPRIPISGMENSPVELFMKATVGSLDGELGAPLNLPSYDDRDLSEFEVGVSYRPCHLFRP